MRFFVFGDGQITNNLIAALQLFFSLNESEDVMPVKLYFAPVPFEGFVRRYTRVRPAGVGFVFMMRWARRRKLMGRNFGVRFW